jgi:hypothetical protein
LFSVPCGLGGKKEVKDRERKMIVKENPKIWLVMWVFIVALVNMGFAERIIYVDADATGANNGSSWESAYKFLQDGLADANSSAKPVEIRVAQGIYKPDKGTGITPGDRMATFQLINGVTIKGGYAGFGEPDLDARDIDIYETILSGDLNGDDTGGWWDPSRGENTYHVVTGSETIDNAIIDGFTITAGYARTVSVPGFGGGGGMCNFWGNPTVVNCTFLGNAAEVPTGSNGGGGGMYNYLSKPTVVKCKFVGNWGNGWGGGMMNMHSEPIVSMCTFNENIATDYGGGVFVNSSSRPRLINCVFAANSAKNGGAVATMNEGDTEILNCTFTGNSANYDHGGAVRAGWYGSVHLVNCILWGNTSEDGSQIQLKDASVVLNFCDVEGGKDGVYDPFNMSVWGSGNINADPLFVDANNRDYHLLSDSPCINAGDPNYVPEPNETDIDGEARVMFVRVDMGSDEFNPIHLGIVNKKRVARTEFAYDCNATFTNLWPFVVKNVELQMMEVPENMTIIEPNVTFGDIQFNTRQSITSIDTCTFQVDRSQAIEPDKIVWKVKCQEADTGMPIELTINGVSSDGLESIAGDLIADGKIGFEDLAALANQWLWVGPAGSIPADITGDGIINLADFAALAATPR